VTSCLLTEGVCGGEQCNELLYTEQHKNQELGLSNQNATKMPLRVQVPGTPQFQPNETSVDRSGMSF
jgi:hypothetical protein